MIKYFKNVNSVILHTSLDPSPLVVNECIALGKIPIVSNRAGNSSDCIVNGLPNFIYSYESLDQTLLNYFKTSHDVLSGYSNELFNLRFKYSSKNISNEMHKFILN